MCKLYIKNYSTSDNCFSYLDNLFSINQSISKKSTCYMHLDIELGYATR